MEWINKATHERFILQNKFWNLKINIKTVINNEEAFKIVSTCKKIEIFDVLGKKVFETISASKEINVSALTAGVYIIKVKEGEATATRKLIVN